jgi:hypothetical protein
MNNEQRKPLRLHGRSRRTDRPPRQVGAFRQVRSVTELVFDRHDPTAGVPFDHVDLGRDAEFVRRTARGQRDGNDSKRPSQTSWAEPVGVCGTLHRWMLSVGSCERVGPSWRSS